MYATRALLLHRKWLDEILKTEDPKTWEVRGRHTNLKVMLLAHESHIYGAAVIKESVPMSIEEIKKFTHKHHINDLSIISYNNPHVYKLGKVTRWSKPVQFTRQHGQIVWCKVQELQCKWCNAVLFRGGIDSLFLPRGRHTKQFFVSSSIEFGNHESHESVISSSTLGFKCSRHKCSVCAETVGYQFIKFEEHAPSAPRRWATSLTQKDRKKYLGSILFLPHVTKLCYVCDSDTNSQFK